MANQWTFTPKVATVSELSTSFTDEANFEGGDYHTLLALVPQYNFGITLLEAGAGEVRDNAPDVLANTILPVIDQIARDQAESTFAGHYASAQGNSSLTVTTAGSDSGLKVTQWISNGVDIFAFLKKIVPDIVFRLQPNQLIDDDGKVSFTSYYSSSTPPPEDASFVFRCPGWFGVDGITYGNIPLGQMVFDVDESGTASAVELRSLRITLERQ